MSKNANDTFDEAFWERRLRYAWQYRKDVMGEEIGYCRLIFGEADSSSRIATRTVDSESW